jgi:hypothetical protein
MRVNQAYGFALDPRPRATVALICRCGPLRLKGGLGPVPEALRGEKRWESGVDLHRLWDEEKRDPQAGLVEGELQVRKEAFRTLERALRDLVDAKTGERRGGPKILSATVSRTAQRWLWSFAVEVEGEVSEHHPGPKTVVGIEVGVTHPIAAVDHRGQVIRIPGPRPVRAALRRLRWASRAQKSSAKRRESAQRLSCLPARIVTSGAAHEASFVGCSPPDNWWLWAVSFLLAH